MRKEVVLLCMCVCVVMTVGLYKSIYRAHVGFDLLYYRGPLKVPCILAVADRDTQNSEPRQEMIMMDNYNVPFQTTLVYSFISTNSAKVYLLPNFE